MKRSFLLLIFCVVSLSGCFSLKKFIPFTGKPSQPTQASQESLEQKELEEVKLLESASSLKDARIVNVERFKEGGKLVILPLKAGVGVESNKELDKIALMIIKGVSEILERENGKITVVFDDGAEDADLIMKGHIVERTVPGKMKKFVLMNKNIELGVEGKLIDRNTGETIVVFSDQQKTNLKEGNFLQLGYTIGQNIGQYIVTALQKL
jgi:hypothetical protein